jgi:hypothetical protein
MSEFSAAVNEWVPYIMAAFTTLVLMTLTGAWITSFVAYSSLKIFDQLAEYGGSGVTHCASSPTAQYQIGTARSWR